MTFFDMILFSELFGQPSWMWLTFLALVTALLAFDLGLFSSGRTSISIRSSVALSLVYVGFGLAFGFWVWWTMGGERGMEYLTGFLIEKSLSLDNVFVFALIFGFFAIPTRLQYRVLFWGILGAIALRAVMIGAGTAVVQNFSWVLYLFGAFLVVTGVKMLVFGDKEYDLAHNPVLAFVKRRMNVTATTDSERFFVRQPAADGRLVLFATPLFLAFFMIIVADAIFAVDSVPAILAITQDPFVVYTSNVFAVLGLRALYFALAAAIHRFYYLKFALALVLVFIGAKIFLVGIIGKTPPAVSLTVTVALLAGGVIWSLLKTRAPARAA
jgi:tellurite resistance protein TerC